MGGRQDSLDGKFATLIEHWDGHSWSVVPSPSPGPDGNELFGVTSRAGVVWAVGQQQGHRYPGGALTERWDGHAWHVVSGPDQRGQTFDPYAAAVTGGQVVVAGSQENGQSAQQTMAFTAGDGRAALTRPLDVGSSENQFYAATSLGNTAWAAGWSADSQPNVQNHSTLIEELTGGDWTVLATPNPGANNALGGISAAPNGDLWAVGSDNAGAANRTLIEQYVP